MYCFSCFLYWCTIYNGHFFGSLTFGWTHPVDFNDSPKVCNRSIMIPAGMKEVTGKVMTYQEMILLVVHEHGPSHLPAPGSVLHTLHVLPFGWDLRVSAELHEDGWWEGGWGNLGDFQEHGWRDRGELPKPQTVRPSLVSVSFIVGWPPRGPWNSHMTTCFRTALGGQEMWH